MLRVAEHFEKSDTGRQRRANEDSFFVRAPLFVVADGMGGAQAGEVASRIAAETFAGGLPRRRARPSSGWRARAATPTGASTSVSQRGPRAQRHGHDADRRLPRRATSSRSRTSATAAPTCFRDGELTRLTHDHSLVDELVRRGKLTEQEAAEHPQRSIITRALGPEPDVEVDTHTLPRAAPATCCCCAATGSRR